MYGVNEWRLLVMRRGIQLALLVIAMAVAGYVRTAVSPLQEALRISLALTDNQTAILQGPVIGIPVTLAAIPLGLMIDRYIRTRLLGVLIVLSLAGSLLTVSASSFGWLLVARCLAGSAALGILPVVFSLLADHYPPSQRGLVTTAAIVGQVVGNSAAFALGGTLLATTGGSSDGWRWAMLRMCAPLMLTTPLTLMLHEPSRTRNSVQCTSARHVWSALQQTLPMVVPLVIGIIAVEIAIGAVMIWASPMLSRAFALPDDQIGSIMAIAMLVSGVMGPAIGGPLADFCQRTGGPRWTGIALSALALMSVPAGLFSSLSDTMSASILLIVSLTITIAIAVMGMTLFTIVVPSDLRGLCMSVLVASELLFSLAVAPPMVSLLSGVMGGLAMIGKALSVVCVSAGVLATAAFGYGVRYFPRATIPHNNHHPSDE